jgi:hypothetical protein
VPLAGHGLRPAALRRLAGRPQLKRDPLGSTGTMNHNPMATPQLPSPRALRLRGVAPLVCAAVVAFITGVNVITAIAALLGALIPMTAAGTFLIGLDIRPDRSPLRATFDFMWDKPTPKRLQRWYVPLVGAAFGGAGAELFRTAILFVGARAPLSSYLLATAAGLGALEGALLALALALGFGIGAATLTPRYRRAA